MTAGDQNRLVATSGRTECEAEVRQEVLLEYGELRKELLQNDQMTLNMLGFALVFASTALTVAFAQWRQNQLLAAAALLSAEGIAIAVALQTLERARNTFTKAAYLRVFIETTSFPGLRWESRLHRLRTEAPTLGFGRFEGFSGQLLVHGFIVVFVTVANTWLLIEQLRTRSDDPLLGVAYGLLLAMAIVGAAWSLMFVIRHHGRFVRRCDRTFTDWWTHIRSLETDTGTSAPTPTAAGGHEHPIDTSTGFASGPLREQVPRSSNWRW